jgi:MFS family permease
MPAAQTVSKAEKPSEIEEPDSPILQDIKTEADDVELGLERTASEPYSVFSTSQKRLIVFMVFLAGFVSPLSSSIYLPALNTLAEHYHKSNSMINLTLTSFMVFQALAPTVVGGLSETLGRRPMYIVASTIYIGANIGLALQDSYAALLVLRCMQSAGSSGTISLALGVVSDISTSSERGTYIGWATSGFMWVPRRLQ